MFATKVSEEPAAFILRVEDMKTVATGSPEMLAAIWQTTKYHNKEAQYLVITLHLNEAAQKMKLTYLNKGLQDTSQYYDMKTVLAEYPFYQTSRFYYHTLYCTSLYRGGGNLHVLCPLLKTVVWKMEMGRRNYCES